MSRIPGPTKPADVRTTAALPRAGHWWPQAEQPARRHPNRSAPERTAPGDATGAVDLRLRPGPGAAPATPRAAAVLGCATRRPARGGDRRDNGLATRHRIRSRRPLAGRLRAMYPDIAGPRPNTRGIHMNDVRDACTPSPTASDGRTLAARGRGATAAGRNVVLTAERLGSGHRRPRACRGRASNTPPDSATQRSADATPVPPTKRHDPDRHRPTPSEAHDHRVQAADPRSDAFVIRRRTGRQDSTLGKVHRR